MTIDKRGLDEHGFDEKILMAYADGELAPAEAARVKTALANDPAAARVVAAHRALRARVGAAFADVLTEPVPSRLVQAAAGANPTHAADPVDVIRMHPDGLHARAAKRPRWSAREWLAMAASLVLGATVGLLILPRDLGADGDDLVDAGFVARNALAHALDEQVSGAGAGRVQVQLSFRAVDGRYCRVFRLHEPRDLAGLACRSGDAWRVTVLAESNAERSGQMRQASTSLPAAVLADIDARIQGESLDARAERDARARGWR